MPYFKSTFAGHIPERLKYVQRPAREVTDYWEHDLWDADDKKRPGVMLRETFVVDIESKKSLETATNWAQRACQVYDGGKYVTRGEILITERANDPIPAIEIISLDVRDEGGRAWKVLLHGLYYVDLREDVLLDALRNGKGVTKGELKGPFIWGVVGSHMKLLRVGSVLHQAVQEAHKRYVSKNVAKGALVEGGIYENRKGDRFAYLGQVDSEIVVCTNEAGRRYNYGYGREWKAHYEIQEIRNQQLWCDIPKYWKKGFEEFFKKEKPSHGGSLATNVHNLKVVKSRTVTGMVEQVTLPKDFMAKLHELTVFEATQRIGHLKEEEAKRKYADVDSIRSYFAYHSMHTFLRRPGEPAPKVPLYDEFLAYVKALPKPAPATP